MKTGGRHYTSPIIRAQQEVLIIRLTKLHITQENIGKQIGLGQGQVGEYVRKLRAEGRLIG